MGKNSQNGLRDRRMKDHHTEEDKEEHSIQSYIHENAAGLYKKWALLKHEHLPLWLQDNEFIIFGHRPPLPCFKTCFRSIFKLHAETGNIWTHLLGFILFIGITVYFLSKHLIHSNKVEMWVFLIFLVGAILCLGFSWTFHTFYCHSETVGKLFSKLDYCGISLLIMGSFVPWVYFGFYCHFTPKLIHLSIVTILGLVAMCVSLLDKFSTPKWRPLRTTVFISFGLSAVIPAVHYGFVEGWFNNISQKALGWLILMGVLYITGALLYVLRVPERWAPGKFDFWFHSHQIFHVFVVAAALVHLQGVSELAEHRLTFGNCDVPDSINQF